MNPFEKEYKNRFEEAKSTDGIDPGAIWENIANALPEEENSATVVKRNFFNRKRYLLLLLLLVLTGSGGLFLMTKEEAPIAETNIEVVGEKSFSEKAKGGERQEKDNAITKSEEKKEVSLNEATKAGIIKSTLSNKKINEETAEDSMVANKDLEEKEITTKLKKETFVKTKTKVEVEAKNRRGEEVNFVSEEINQTKLEEQKSKDLSSVKTQEVEINRDLIKEKASESIKPTGVVENSSITKEFLGELSLPIVYGDFPFVDLRDISKVDREPTLPLKKKGRNRKVTLGFSAGLMGWSNLYQNNDQVNVKEILEETTSTDLGQSLAISLRWNLTKKIHLSTGFEYLNARTEFNHIAEWDSLAIVEGYESLGLIDAVATRTVKHNNQHRFLSVPIMIGTSKDFAAFELGVELGFGLNYIISQKGKSLNAEAVIEDYDSKNNNKIPYRKFFLSYQFQPYLNFAVTERFAVQLQPTFRYQQHGKSNLYGSDVSSFSWGLRFGGLIGF